MKRFALPFAALLALSGCGLSPMYSGGGHGAVAQGLAAVEVPPIKQLDARTIGDGKPGPITRRIQGVFNDTVHGKLPQYRQWLAYAAPELATASPNS